MPMLDIKFIREHPDRVKDGLAKRGVEFGVDQLLQVDERRRHSLAEVERLRAAQNKLADEIAHSVGDQREDALIASKNLKEDIAHKEFKLKTLEEEFISLMYRIPNLPDEDVPVGQDVVVREVGEKPQFDFPVKDYFELGQALDLIDNARAARVSGSRFGYLKHEAPLLEFALIQFAMAFLTNRKNIAEVIRDDGLHLSEKPFIPVVPPVLIRPEAMRAMGYVERGGEEIYFIEKDQLYLVGTSEQSVGPMHMEEAFDEGELPHRYVAFSSCFRREAGSYGRDTKGILRVHQFDKVEMLAFAASKTSPEEHRLLVALEERLYRRLGIPYRLVHTSTADLADPAVNKYDLEAWLPGQNEGRGEYREITSASNTTDFQARRLNIKVRRKDGSTEFVHLLNGTAFAVGRTLIAILENFQQADGSVKIPEALLPYMHGITEIRGERKGR